jgi:DNA modification methylase
MPKFTYHPPTRTHCSVCEELAKRKSKPIMDMLNGKASSAGNFPIHNWYYFVLGYTPAFPDFILGRENVDSSHFVVDPFVGAGTTLVTCKQKGIPSLGIDANDYFIDVVRTKVNWKPDTKKAKEYKDKIINCALASFRKYKSNLQDVLQGGLFLEGQHFWEEYAAKHRPAMLDQRYMSDIPFAKLHILQKKVGKIVEDHNLRQFFDLAISSIIVPISNARYGPGFGLIKPKTDVDVLDIFSKKIERMIEDVESLNDHQYNTPARVIHGDSRELLKYLEPNSVDLMITSPPYAGDHEYTKHTRLELIFMGYANDVKEFRTIKKRMLRGSTTNLYKEDRDGELVRHFQSIEKVTKLIDERLKDDGATSGFEKLYTRLVWEYFGGMHRMLTEAYSTLKSGGKISLLVSDSHAFKMVHILTAEILAEVGCDIGYRDVKVELWQDKPSTSHKYHLRENIVTLTK